MSSKTIQRIVEKNSIEWNNIMNNKFTAEIGSNQLPYEKFAFYLKQDNNFLVHFCSLLRSAQSKSSSPFILKWLENLQQSTIGQEMVMQQILLRELEDRFDIYLQFSKPAPAALRYIKFLDIISNNTIEEIIAAMAPCPWSYYEIAKRLSFFDIKAPAYKKWVDFYASEDSKNQVFQLKQIFSLLYANADQSKKIKMEEYFNLACHHEIQFWDMAYTLQ